jgi:hypothetical protein
VDAFGDDNVALDWWQPAKAGSYPPHPRFRDARLYVGTGPTPSAAEQHLAQLLDDANAPDAFR